MVSESKMVIGMNHDFRTSPIASPIRPLVVATRDDRRRAAERAASVQHRHPCSWLLAAPAAATARAIGLRTGLDTAFNRYADRQLGPGGLLAPLVDAEVQEVWRHGQDKTRAFNFWKLPVFGHRAFPPLLQRSQQAPSRSHDQAPHQWVIL
jgi:hypothetical protein